MTAPTTADANKEPWEQMLSRGSQTAHRYRLAAGVGCCVTVKAAAFRLQMTISASISVSSAGVNML